MPDARRRPSFWFLDVLLLAFDGHTQPPAGTSGANAPAGPSAYERTCERPFAGSWAVKSMLVRGPSETRSDRGAP